MPLLFPTQGTLHDVFHPAIPFGRRPDPPAEAAPTPKRTPLQARSELYSAWSVVDDAKNKASKLSAEATKEFEKASAKAQAKAGHIELYSAKYYAACTFGGLLACVSTSPS
jgi:solute carrier family 25 (mitochondrial phosphate transporter), member 3